MRSFFLFETLQLMRSEGVGPLTFHKLLTHFNTPDKILAAWPEVSKTSKRRLVLASAKKVEKEIHNTEKLGAFFLTLFDPDYPPLLKEIIDAPPVLVVRGSRLIFQKNALAIVGARNASPHGGRLAYRIAQKLGEEAWCIVSGLARGIDTQAHQGGLKTGTIAVLAGGIDQIYPEENRGLAQEILEKGGALVTEVPFGISPQASHFPRRNRLISGLAQGVLVVEASVQSGSLITANCAAEQGRDIFAVPGSPMDPRCRGTNFLLKQGAILTESAQDVLDSYTQGRRFEPKASQSTFDFETQHAQSESTQPPKNSLSGSTEKEQVVLNYLSFVPIDANKLALLAALSVQDLLPMLLKLELSGRVVRHPGDLFSLQEEMS